MADVSEIVANADNNDGGQEGYTKTPDSNDVKTTSGSTEQAQEAIQYPTGIRLFLIGMGLMLAVMCSNLVGVSIRPPVQHAP